MKYYGFCWKYGWMYNRICYLQPWRAVAAARPARKGILSYATGARSDGTWTDKHEGQYVELSRTANVPFLIGLDKARISHFSQGRTGHSRVECNQRTKVRRLKPTPSIAGLSPSPHQLPRRSSPLDKRRVLPPAALLSDFQPTPPCFPHSTTSHIGEYGKMALPSP